MAQLDSVLIKRPPQTEPIINYQTTPVKESSKGSFPIILFLLIISFVFNFVLMLIQFKLRKDMKTIEKEEEKKYRYKTRNLLKSIEEQKSELSRLRKIAISSQQLQSSYDKLQKNSTRLDLLKNAIIAIKHPVIITDLQGKIMFCNPEFASLLKTKSIDLLGKKLHDLFDAVDSLLPIYENLSEWENSQFTLSPTGQPEIQLLAKPELLRDPEKKTLAIVISFLRIDTLAKEDKNEMSSMQKFIFENIQDIYFEVDMEGTIIEISPSVSDYADTDRSDLINQNIDVLFADKNMKNEFLKILEKEKEILNFEINLKAAEDKSLPCSISAHIVDNDLEPRIIGSIRNIIDLKLIEAKRIQAIEELLDVNKDLMDFAHITSHDLKSPLRAINTLANWILTDDDSSFSTESKNNMQILIGRTEKMHQLIEAIYEYINIINFETEKVLLDTGKVIENIIRKIGVPADFSLEISPSLPQIYFERTRLEQIFENLIDNSIKFMNKEKGRITINCKEEDSEWQFSVADNGPGIEEKYFDKVFQIFQVLDASEENQGTGIGLAIVKKIIEKNKGKIWLESVPDNGLTVFFTIPKFRED